MRTAGTYHYIAASLGGKIIGVYGAALREFAFEKAQTIRENGIACEVFTRSGYRCPPGATLPKGG